MIHYEEERFGNASYIEYAYHENFSFPIHFHRCLEFVFVLDGHLDVLYPTQKIALCKNQGILLLPNTIHGYESSSSSALVSLVFSPDWIMPFMQQVEGTQPLSPKFSIQDYLLIHYIKDFSQHLNNPLKVQGILLLLCSLFLEQVTLIPDTYQSQHLLHQIIHYMQGHFKEDLQLGTLAQALGYDASYLSRYISQHMHTTFHTYLTNLRLAHATYLLEHTELKVIDIAMQSGFSSIRTFNGLFKKNYGISPITYKQTTKRGTSHT